MPPDGLGTIKRTLLASDPLLNLRRTPPPPDTSALRILVVEKELDSRFPVPALVLSPQQEGTSLSVKLLLESLATRDPGRLRSLLSLISYNRLLDGSGFFPRGPRANANTSRMMHRVW